jgi:hypothetical protein
MLIKPNTTPSDDDHGNKTYNPIRPDGTWVCCCGYELIKDDDNLYRCTGGSHRYEIREGDVTRDKFGNVEFKLPEGFKK